MSGPNVNAELIIRLRDETAAGAKGVTTSAKTAAKDVQTAFEQASKAASTAAERGAAMQRTSYQRLAQAREQLGIRSEQVIQREIQRTTAAYERLARAGFKSAEDQARAYERTKSVIARLTNEMGRLTAEQKRAADGAAALERGQRALRNTAAVGAGIAAAGYSLKAPAMAAIGFDERLADMASTAFVERDTAGRKVGMRQLEAAINRSVLTGGGGTREQAAATLDAMIASGAMTSSEAMAALPQIMRFSTAANADPTELANIGIRAMQTFKVGAADLPNIMNMAIAAGQAGGFELKDMARWLPQQMAAATMSGLSGRAGFARLAALNQAAAITAGTKDEAGNNVVNLLAKINSRDTALDAKKLGIDLPAYLQQRRAAGVDSVTAFGELIDKTVADRADYKALQQRLAGAKGDSERRATLESMATIAQGAGIGKLVQDRQAMMALLGMMNNKAYMDHVLATVRANDVAQGGGGDKNYELKSETSAFALRKAGQAIDVGVKRALDVATPAIGSVASAFGDLAEKYPELTGATVLATGAIASLATVSGAATLAMGGKFPGAGTLGRWLGAGAASGAAMAGGSAAAGGGGAVGAATAGIGKLALAANAGLAVGPLAAMWAASEWAGNTAHDQQRAGALQDWSGVLDRALSMIGLGKGGDIEARRARNRADLGGDGPGFDGKLIIGLAPGLAIVQQSMQTSGGNMQVNTGNLASIP